MKKIISLCIVMCCLFSITGCSYSKDEIVDKFNQVLQELGDDTLTRDRDLQGEREFGEDSYVGTYRADYDSFTGEEKLFGGTSLERTSGNEIHISCDLDIAGGKAKLLLLTGDEEPQILCDTSTSYSDTLELPSASNYIIIQTENFTGSVDLTVE